MESLLRVGVFLLFGGVLLLANFWFVSQAFSNFVRPGIVIAPFEIVGQTGDPATGKTLANLLQARLQQLVRELEAAQNSLRHSPPPPAEETLVEVGIADAINNDRPSPPPALSFWQPIRLNATLFSPTDMKVAVAGVEVGSVIPWVQRLVVKPDMLTFTVSYESGRALIAGDIAALHTGTTSLWTETASPAPTKIADLLAHEIVLRKLSMEQNSRFAALDVSEFQVLSHILLETVKLNRRITQRRVVREDFVQLVPGVESLIDKVPDWRDLLFLAGMIAENAGMDDKALLFYTKLDIVLHKRPEAQNSEQDLRRVVEAKVKHLRAALPKGFMDGLGRRMLNLLGIFEIGSDDPLKLFGRIDAIGNDVTFGLAQWNCTSGTLGPLLHRFQETDPVLFSQLMRGGEAQIQPVLSGDREVGLAFARQIVGADGKVMEPWVYRFEALGRQPKFQEIQIRATEPWFRRAVSMADEFGLRSARGLMFCFDIVVYRGGIHGTWRREIEDSFNEFRKTHSREPDEVERMNMMTAVLVAAGAPKYRRIVEERMKVVVDGGGLFRGRNVEGSTYALDLTDFRTGEVISFHTPSRRN